MTTPYCPKCGSIKVGRSADKKSGHCLEPGCKHKGPWRKFTDHIGTSHQPNQHWRDPVALSMDGYDGS